MHIPIAISIMPLMCHHCCASNCSCSGCTCCGGYLSAHYCGKHACATTGCKHFGHCNLDINLDLQMCDIGPMLADQHNVNNALLKSTFFCKPKRAQAHRAKDLGPRTVKRRDRDYRTQISSGFCPTVKGRRQRWRPPGPRKRLLGHGGSP